MKYYTTSVNVDQTIAEISKCVREMGGTRFGQEWDDDGQTVAIVFALDTDHGQMPVRMECEADRIMAKLSNDKSPNLRPKHRTFEHASRVAWRRVKHMVEGISMAVKDGVVTPQEALLGYAILKDGRTFGHAFRDEGMRLLE